MFPRMTQSELLNTLQSERARWEALLAEVPETRMTQPGAAGIWSVKDVIAHITECERWILGQVNPALRADIPVSPPNVDMDNIEQVNAWYYSLNRDRPLPDVLADARRVYTNLLEAICARSEDELNTPVRADAANNLEPTTWDDTTAPVLWPLWKWIADETCEHYPQHYESLRAWIDKSEEG